MSWRGHARNGLKFRSREIWDHFDFCPDVRETCPDVRETVSNFTTAKYWTVSIFVLTFMRVALTFAKRSQISQPRNMGPYRFLSWYSRNGLNFCSREIWDHFNFSPDVRKTAINVVSVNMGTNLILLNLSHVSIEMKINFLFLTCLCHWH